MFPDSRKNSGWLKISRQSRKFKKICKVSRQFAQCSRQYQWFQKVSKFPCGLKDVKEYGHFSNNYEIFLKSLYFPDSEKNSGWLKISRQSQKFKKIWKVSRQFTPCCRQYQWFQKVQKFHFGLKDVKEYGHFSNNYEKFVGSCQKFQFQFVKVSRQSKKIPKRPFSIKFYNL